jgi:hypothetical protein
VGDSDAEREFTHTRLAPRVLYSLTRSNFLAQARGGDPLALSQSPYVHGRRSLMLIAWVRRLITMRKSHAASKQVLNIATRCLSAHQGEKTL